VDTNVLVYAEDRDAGAKHDRAVELIRGLWESGEGVLSIQVLQEFFVTVTRKVRQPMKAEAAARVVEQYLSWRTIENDGHLLLASIDLAREHQVSFWDALVIRAALTAGCDVLYSEDLSHGRRYRGLRIVNPFIEQVPLP
jgi:predicted nucleic acid-binding protein